MSNHWGIELELGVLLALVVLGTSVFGVFEVETPRWRRLIKWLSACGGTVGLYLVFGHVALALPAVLVVGAVWYHLWWCHRHGIHAVKATPRRKYYALRGWPWPE